MATETQETETQEVKKTYRPRKPLEGEAIAKTEAVLREKYPQVIEGSFQNTCQDPESEFYHKRTVEIACATEGCSNTRRVATSDLHQVRYCKDCSAKVRANRRKKAAKKAEQPEPAAV